MKKIIYALFLIVSTYCFALREVDGVLYRQYVNSRFGFSLEYPAEILFMQPPPENNDGRKFLSDNEEASMLIYGTYTLLPINDEIDDSNLLKNVENNYYYTLYNDYGNANVTYKVLKESKGLYIVSGIINDKIFYKRVQLVANSEPYFMVFMIEYPIIDKDIYNKIIEIVIKSIEI